MTEIFNEDDFDGESFLACAARVAQAVENLEGHSEVMSLIAVRCAGLGLLDVAVQLTETITDPYARDQALANIAAECVGFDEADYADELIKRLEDPGLYGVAMEQTAVKYAESSAFDKALEIAREMDDSGPTLSRIAFICADGGLFAQAIEVIRSIEDAGLKATALIELAARGLRSGRNREGAELLVEAARTAEEIEFTQERINALIDIAFLHQETGQEEQSFETLSRSYQLCDEVEGATDLGRAQDYARDEALAKVATCFARLQRYDQAELVTEKIENPFPFAAALADVALEYHKAGQSGQALTLLTEALEVVKEEEVYGERGLMLRESLLARLAVFYATVGHYEKSLQIAGMISSLDLQLGALRDVAKTCVRSGNHSWISRAAEMMPGTYAKVLFDIEISDALVESEQSALANRTLSQALASTETIERADDKALALTEIALRHVQRDQASRASDLLFQALTTTALINDSYQKARVLIELDGKYRKAGQEAGERERRVLQEIAP